MRTPIVRAGISYPYGQAVATIYALEAFLHVNSSSRYYLDHFYLEFVRQRERVKGVSIHSVLIVPVPPLPRRSPSSMFDQLVNTSFTMSGTRSTGW